MATTGWKLDRGERDALLARVPPRYAETVADHVTLAARVTEDAALPQPAAARVVGRVDDGRGVEALVVAVDGSTDRPDGGTFHVTWSLAEGRRARESNDAIAAQGWEPLDCGAAGALTLAPARW